MLRLVVRLADVAFEDEDLSWKGRVATHLIFRLDFAEWFELIPLGVPANWYQKELRDLKNQSCRSGG